MSVFLLPLSTETFLILRRIQRDIAKMYIRLHVKVKVQQSRYRPGVAQTVSGSFFPRFHDNGRL